MPCAHALALVLLSAAYAAAATSLTLGTLVSAGSPWGTELKAMASAVAHRSGGAVLKEWTSLFGKARAAIPAGTVPPELMARVAQMVQ